MTRCIPLAFITVLAFALSSASRVPAADTTLVTLDKMTPTACRLHMLPSGKAAVVVMQSPHSILDATTARHLGDAARASKQMWHDMFQAGRSSKSFFVYKRWADEGVHVIDLDRLLEYEIDLKNTLVHDYDVSPDGRILAVTHKDVHLFDLRTMEPMGHLPRPKDDCYATSIAFSPDSKHVIVTNGGFPRHKEHGGFPRTITRWRLDDRAADRTVECDGASSDTAVTPDGKTFITNGSRRGLERYEFQTLERLGALPINSAPDSIDFSPDGKCLLVRAGEVGKGMMIIDTTTWDVLARYQTNPDEAVSDAKFLSNNEVVYRLHPETRTIRKWTWK
jgi:WD40 repeat protein